MSLPPNDTVGNTHAATGRLGGFIKRSFRVEAARTWPLATFCNHIHLRNPTMYNKSLILSLFLSFFMMSCGSEPTAAIKVSQDSQQAVIAGYYGESCYSPLLRRDVPHGQMGKKKCCWNGDWTRKINKCSKRSSWVCTFQNSYTYSTATRYANTRANARRAAFEACKDLNPYRGLCQELKCEERR